jgi:hypothetical protein
MTERKILTYRELSTLQAALRYFQANRDDVKEAVSHFDDVTPLDDREVDTLCELLDSLAEPRDRDVLVQIRVKTAAADALIRRAVRAALDNGVDASYRTNEAERIEEERALIASTWGEISVVETATQQPRSEEAPVSEAQTLPCWPYPHKYPRFCPACKADLTEPKSVRIELDGVGYALTSLNKAWQLKESPEAPGLVAQGRHKGSACAVCAGGLDDFEILAEAPAQPAVAGKEPLRTYAVNLRGTPEMEAGDATTKWVRSPSLAAVSKFLEGRPFGHFADVVELIEDGDDYGFQDGVDCVITSDGLVDSWAPDHKTPPCFGDLHEAKHGKFLRSATKEEAEQAAASRFGLIDVPTDRVNCFVARPGSNSLITCHVKAFPSGEIIKRQNKKG